MHIKIDCMSLEYIPRLCQGHASRIWKCVQVTMSRFILFILSCLTRLTLLKMFIAALRAWRLWSVAWRSGSWHWVFWKKWSTQRRPGKGRRSSTALTIWKWQRWLPHQAIPNDITYSCIINVCAKAMGGTRQTKMMESKPKTKMHLLTCSHYLALQGLKGKFMTPSKAMSWDVIWDVMSPLCYH